MNRIDAETGKQCKRLFAGFLLLACTATQVAADRAFTIKIATVAPKGSVYHRVLQEVGEKWRIAQGEAARFLIYTDGRQGTEADAVRRMRVGQLQGSMLTVAGLKEIDESVAALQLMPLVFRSWDEVDYVRNRLRPDLERRLRERGFVVLFWGEGGWVQFFSDEPRLTPDDFKPARIFAWAGTNAQVELMKSLDYRPVVLELTDILPSLQTGMIDVVPAAPMWALAGQFYPSAPHMLRMNWVPIVGATVITTMAWEAMRPLAREALLEAAAVADDELRAHRNTLDDKAIQAMQARGLIVHDMTPEIEQAWQDTIRPIWPRIRGTMVPAEMFDRVHSLLAAYRGSRQ